MSQYQHTTTYRVIAITAPSPRMSLVLLGIGCVVRYHKTNSHHHLLWMLFLPHHHPDTNSFPDIIIIIHPLVG
jgi:hypothetical protein